MLEACLSSFQSFQIIKYHQTIEIIHSIRKEIIPTFSKLLNEQMNNESRVLLESKGENKRLLEKFEKVSKVHKFLLLTIILKKINYYNN